MGGIKNEVFSAKYILIPNVLDFVFLHVEHFDVVDFLGVFLGDLKVVHFVRFIVFTQREQQKIFSNVLLRFYINIRPPNVPRSVMTLQYWMNHLLTVELVDVLEI